jgi:nucleoside-diphosphate-sugar epimerase
MHETSTETSQKPTAFVTGATGFVGSHLARRLVQEGWNVHIIIRAGSVVPTGAEFSHMTTHIHDGSTASMISCVALARPDVVFHLSSMFLSQHKSQDIEALIQSNLLFGTQMLEAMEAIGVKHIINTGTSWQHYNNEDYNPTCLYAATKQAFEAILEYYVQACGFKAITLKLFDTYGPDDLRPKLFNLLNKAATTIKELDMSAGEQLIDIVHIEDVVDAYLIAALRLCQAKVLHHEIYAVSSGYPLPLKELVLLYSEATKKEVKVNWGARPYRVRELMTTWENGKSIENWKPKLDLRGWLMKMVKENSLQTKL